MMSLAFVGIAVPVNPPSAFVGASLLATRGRIKSIAGKLAPTVGVNARPTWRYTEASGDKLSGRYPPVCLGASLLAIRRHKKNITSQPAPTVEAPAGSGWPR
jgi:hypothetical protein